MALTITSSAFSAGQTIPTPYTGDGRNVSPPLSWTGVPAGTAELALIVDDPDAPMAEPFVHWVMYQIPPSAVGLPENVPAESRLKTMGGIAGMASSGKTTVPGIAADGVLQGRTSFMKVGYGGPAPPRGHGTHHYHFRVYALDRPLKAPGGLDKKSLLAAMAGHIIGEAELVGTYERR